MLRRLRVVSWNVGRIYTPTSNNKLADSDIPRVAAVLHELDPDVVLLQEFVSETQLAALTARLRGYVGRMSTACRYDRHVAALAREALEPDFEDRVLEPTGRGLVSVTFSVGEAGRGSAHAVHLDAFRAAGRRSQAEAICAFTDERDEPVTVVGGDFNLDPDWAARVRDRLDRGTYALFTSRFRAPRPAGPTLMGLFRVDHLLARGPLVDEVRGHVSPHRRLPLGDHDPIVCDLTLRARLR
jgi:endonuclease/exonuclease/phosphatase family metal-dependent hydrolase